MTLIRLQKYLSDCGICSRRKGEYYIQNNYISVNGKKVTLLGTKIDPVKDIVHFQEKRVLPRPKHHYMMLNKPEGYTCTMARHKSEQNLESLLPKIHHLYPVGRLDKDSEGLLIVTTDGAFAQKIMHPKNKCEKEYFVIVMGAIQEKDMEQLEKGITLDMETPTGEIKKRRARIKSASLIKRETGRSYVSVILEEGQKRQIRRMFQSLGFPVQYLKRIRIGSVSLDRLAKGKARALTAKEIASF